MEVLVLVILLLSEIGLFTHAVMSKPEKKQWTKNKLFVHTGQFVFFLIALILPSVNLNLRFKLIFAILILRVFFSGISYIISKNKNSRKNLLGVFASLLANIIVIIIALMPAFIFANYNGLENSGSHAVASTDFILLDKNRDDPFEGAGSHREVPVHAFYPADGGSINEYPLVVFSHGAFGYFESNMSSYTELVSRGYVVLSIEHPHHSLYTKNSSGKTVLVDSQFINDVMMVNDVVTPEEEIFTKSSEWIGLRIADENFALDEIENAKKNGQIPSNWYLGESNSDEILSILEMTDTTNVGLYGHSLGGATSVTVGRNRPEVNAVIDLDGTMLGEETGYNNETYEYNNEAYPKPLLNVTSEIHFAESQQAGLLYVNSYICENAINATTIWFKGTAHMNFTDLPLFSPFLASNLGVGTVDAEKCVVQLNDVVADYFDYYLKGEGELTLQECYE